MRHVFLFLWLLVSPAWADDDSDNADPNQYTPKYLDLAPAYPLIPTGPQPNNPYVAPSTGNVYIPVAPNVVIDTRTGQALTVH